MSHCKNYEYDVVLSFAGEDREYVRKCANFLVKTGIRVFYDEYEDVNLWGKDLYQHLDNIYQNLAKYSVIFISESYKNKLWTNHELKSAQTRAFSEREEYILPTRFDNTEIPGIRKTIGYLDLRSLTPIQLAKKIIKKLDKIEPENFLPEDITFIKQAINLIYEDFDEDEIELSVYYIFDLLKKTSKKEKEFIYTIIKSTCHHDLFEDFHENMKLFERELNYKKDEILEVIRGMLDLGFEYSISKTDWGCSDEGNEYQIETLHIKLISRNPNIPSNLTFFLYLMYYGVLRYYCSECAKESLYRLDFSLLKEDIEEDEQKELLELISTDDFEE